MKLRSSFVCQQCGFETPQWLGKCPGCQNWNSLVETVKEVESKKSKVESNRLIVAPQKLSEVKHIETDRLKTNIAEFDRVMGGGIVPGSVTLLAGDPGIGKSTILLHVLASIGGVYVAGEESAEQVKLRAKRLGIEGDNIVVVADTNVENVIESVEKLEVGGRNSEAKKNIKNSPNSNFNIPNSLVIVDSIQTISSDDLEGMAGSVGQIRRSAEKLIAFAKLHHVPIIIIGHVTKEGSIAGPKVLEHMVDVVLFLEGERFATARILRSLKNRFGAIEEVGLFEMNDNGLKEIANPSELFLRDRVKNVPGSVVTVLLEGTRPLLIEIQALVIPSQLAIPRRIANGFDVNRLQLLTAIIQKRLSLPIGTSDIFVNVSGGMKVSEPAADLAVAMAIISSFMNKSVHPKTAVFGEVGLLGEIRSTTSEGRRINEAKRLGFDVVISPAISKSLRDAVKTFNP